MIRAVVKWSYIKERGGLARAKAHINYIQYREGADREQGPRKFFNIQSSAISGALVKARLDELNQRGVQIHKIILSPGLNNADMLAYVQEMMDKLSRSKGLDLEWYAVKHDNTEHLHSHVVVMGTDLQGRPVHLGGKDSKSLRKWGNDFLEREHHLDRYLDGELKRLLHEPTRAAALEYQRQRGDQEFERLMFGSTSGNHDEWGRFEQEMQSILGPEQSDDCHKSCKQYQTESAGRLIDFHERYQQQAFTTYWEDIAQALPELANNAQRELAWLNEIKQDRDHSMDAPDLDQLLTGLNSVERYLRTFVTAEINQLEREGIVIARDDESRIDAINKHKALFGEEDLDRHLARIEMFNFDQREERHKHNRENRER